MEILHVVPYWTYGGVEFFLRTLSEHSKHRHWLYQYDFSSKVYPPFGELNVHHLQHYGVEPDIVHWHHIKSIGKGDYRYGSVFTVHNIFGEEAECIDADRIVAVSQGAAGAVMKHGVRVDDIIPSPVDIDIFRPTRSTEDRQLDTQCRRKLGIDLLPNRPVVTWVGRICPGKNPGFLVRLIGNRPQYTWIIVGDDYLQGDMGHTPQDVRVSLRNRSGVRRIPSVAHSSMPSIYRVSDVVISTSYAEGFGLTIAEAMACGRSVVVPDVIALRELVGYGEFGEVESFDVERFCEAIDRAISQDRFEDAERRVNRIYGMGADAAQVVHRYDMLYEGFEERRQYGILDARVGRI